MADRVAQRRQAYAAEITRRAGVTQPDGSKRRSPPFRARISLGRPPWWIGSGGFGLIATRRPSPTV